MCGGEGLRRSIEGLSRSREGGVEEWCGGEGLRRSREGIVAALVNPSSHLA